MSGEAEDDDEFTAPLGAPYVPSLAQIEARKVPLSPPVSTDLPAEQQIELRSLDEPPALAAPLPVRSTELLLQPAAAATEPSTPQTIAMEPPVQPSPVPAQIPQPLAEAVSPSHPPARLTLGDAFGERLGVAIARRIQGGAEEVSVRMEPAELGRIEVRLAFDDSGSLRAVVSTESLLVQDAIRRDLGEIVRALFDAGVRTDAQSFRFDRGSSGSGGSSEAAADGGQRGWHGSSGGHSSGGREQQEQYRPYRRNGRLDLMA